jgi:hypothetical protein
MKPIPCPACQQPVAPADLLAGATCYNTLTDSSGAPCPHCRQGIEFRARTGTLELGCTYWAGSLHFEAMITHRLAALRREDTTDAVLLHLDDRHFHLPHFPPPP